MQPGTSPAPHERSRCSFFFFETAVLINNLSHTTTNPWANVGNTSLFPSLSFYHKHINICLTRVLRCAARPHGPHQVACTHKGHVKMRPTPIGPNGWMWGECVYVQVCVDRMYTQFSLRISVCAEGCSHKAKVKLQLRLSAEGGPGRHNAL